MEVPMFFGSKTVSHLEADHKAIREFAQTLKSSSASSTEKHAAFLQMVPVLVSHARREEAAIYQFMKSSGHELKSMAYEGEAEHEIVEKLVEELKGGSLSEVVWSAKAKVLGELLEHHMTEEENDAFPKLKRE